MQGLKDIPYLHYENYVINAMSKAGCWPGMEWFNKEKHRLEKDWDLCLSLSLAMEEWVFRGKRAIVEEKSKHDNIAILAKEKGWIEYV